MVPGRISHSVTLKICLLVASKWTHIHIMVKWRYHSRSVCSIEDRCMNSLGEMEQGINYSHKLKTESEQSWLGCLFPAKLGVKLNCLCNGIKGWKLRWAPPRGWDWHW